MTKVYLTWDDVYKGVKDFVEGKNLSDVEVILGISRGGIVPATLMSKETGIPMKIVDPFGNVDEFKGKKVLVVDDIYDTGRTLAYFKKELPDALNYVVIAKEDKSTWVVFPWETSEDKVGGVEQAVVTLLRAAGEDPMREGVLETPSRFAKAWAFWTQGYGQKSEDVMKVFENPSLDQLVVVKDIEFYSMCEHHMAPFFGKIHIGYIPNGKVLGVSKFARLSQIYSRRLQIQEKLTKQIADDIMKYLEPKGVAVVVEAEHLCMKSRGVQTQNSLMQTSEMLGIFREEAPLRSEFMQLIGRSK